jgi:hypothetical protein
MILASMAPLQIIPRCCLYHIDRYGFARTLLRAFFRLVLQRLPHQVTLSAP